MQINITETELCRLNVQFEADPEQVEEKRAEVLQFFKREQIPGFRQHKAPLSAVKLHFKDKINEVMKNELAQNAYQTVLAEHNIKPFGQPQLLSSQLEGSKFTCNFGINKIPDVTLQQYKGFELPKGNVPDAVEMSERILQELRNRNGETTPYADADFVQANDTIIVNFEGFIPEQELPVTKSDGEIFVVGKAPVTEFNDNLLGMKIGEKREFVAHMPKNDTPISEKDVRFVVELVMGSKCDPCPLDDALAVKVGAKNLQEMMGMTQGMASNRVQELNNKHLSEQTASRLVANHQLEIPTWLSAFEAKLLAKQYGNDWDNLPDEHKANYAEFATRNIKLSIILNKIREVEPDAQLADEEVFKHIQTNITKYKGTLPGMEGKTDQEVLETVSNSGYLPALISTIRDEFTLEYIIKNCSIVE